MYVSQQSLICSVKSLCLGVISLMWPLHVNQFINGCAYEASLGKGVLFSKPQLDVDGISTKKVKDVGQPGLTDCPSMSCFCVCHGRKGSMLKWLQY